MATWEFCINTPILLVDKACQGKRCSPDIQMFRTLISLTSSFCSIGFGDVACAFKAEGIRRWVYRSCKGTNQCAAWYVARTFVVVHTELLHGEGKLWASAEGHLRRTVWQMTYFSAILRWNNTVNVYIVGMGLICVFQKWHNSESTRCTDFLFLIKRFLPWVSYKLRKY